MSSGWRGSNPCSAQQELASEERAMGGTRVEGELLAPPRFSEKRTRATCLVAVDGCPRRTNGKIHALLARNRGMLRGGTT